ncbi:MAG TPA: hypothetical protein VFE50_04685 [Cyclobacteriaceae bacterium]|nr:hypothetical protein [Cyclobacteriaceae bacterium]
MTRVLTLFAGLFILLGSACTQKMICPAYQSSFIYDKETLRKKFSYFKEDSTPKILTASKTKYLVAVPESYRKKMRGLKTVEMKPVFPVIPDSMKIDKEGDKLMLESDVVDSTAAAPQDSVYAITKTKEKYNVDQDIYMWYFRDQLVLPDVRAAMETQNKNKEAKAAAKSGKKKGLAGFFKNLFKKNKNDSTAVEEQPLIPTDTTAAPPPKKGLKGLFGGKKKDPAAPEKKKEDAKKEDDGF